MKTRRKHEVIEGTLISCWDDGPLQNDRYTIVDLDSLDKKSQTVLYYALNECPFSPNMGVALTGSTLIQDVTYKGRGGIFKKRIAFSELPEDVQKAARQWLKDSANP